MSIGTDLEAPIVARRLDALAATEHERRLAHGAVRATRELSTRQALRTALGAALFDCSRPQLRVCVCAEIESFVFCVRTNEQGTRASITLRITQHTNQPRSIQTNQLWSNVRTQLAHT